MKRIGITGQSGFIGTQLHRRVQQEPDWSSVPFEDSFFEDPAQLRRFVASCDVIVHLAAINRHPDPQILHDTNIRLTTRLIEALEAENTRPFFIFSSSIQENRNNLYGESKRRCRLLLQDWAERHRAPYTGLIIPNVFGPTAPPHYNSFIATFSAQLLRDEIPNVFEDRPVDLIYIDSLCRFITGLIHQEKSAAILKVPADFNRTVSEILETLISFYKTHVQQGNLPSLKDQNEANVFHTFQSYIK